MVESDEVFCLRDVVKDFKGVSDEPLRSASEKTDQAKSSWCDLPSEALRMQLRLVVLDCALSVCKLEKLPESLLDDGFCCATRTEDELSVVCETCKVPEGVLAREDGLRALKVQGPLDFALVGILARISLTLANAHVPLFAISTYDTDYILVNEENLGLAIVALRDAGCTVIA